MLAIAFHRVPVPCAHLELIGAHLVHGAPLQLRSAAGTRWWHAMVGGIACQQPVVGLRSGEQLSIGNGRCSYPRSAFTRLQVAAESRSCCRLRMYHEVDLKTRKLLTILLLLLSLARNGTRSNKNSFAWEAQTYFYGTSCRKRPQLKTTRATRSACHTLLRRRGTGLVSSSGSRLGRGAVARAASGAPRAAS